MIKNYVMNLEFIMWCFAAYLDIDIFVENLQMKWVRKVTLSNDF